MWNLRFNIHIIYIYRVNYGADIQSEHTYPLSSFTLDSQVIENKSHTIIMQTQKNHKLTVNSFITRLKKIILLLCSPHILPHPFATVSKWLMWLKTLLKPYPPHASNSYSPTILLLEGQSQFLVKIYCCPPFSLLCPTFFSNILVYYWAYYHIRGNFRQEKIFINFAICSYWRNFYHANFFVLC